MKKSFADCGSCTLCDSTGKVCETNSQKDLSNIDELYIADPTEWSIVKKVAEEKKLRYLITAPILCSLSGKEKIDLNVVFDLCKTNAVKIIEKCHPKKLITIGDLAKEFTGSCGNSAHYDNVFDLAGIDEPSGEEFDLSTFSDNPLKNIKKQDAPVLEVSGGSNLYMFTIPEKYYTDEYRLVDVQQVASQHRIIYIFRDKNNKKEFYEFPGKDNDFYWYESLSTDGKIIEPFQNLQLHVGSHKDRCQNMMGYGGDVNLTTLHTVDYFLQNKGEAPVVNKNIVHFDIEVFVDGVRTFPDPEASAFPINAISFRSNDDSDHTRIYLLKIPGKIDPRIDEIIKSNKYPNMTVFYDEYTLLRSFFAKVKELDPDFICGWNSNGFDLPYIVGRMKKLSIDMRDLSPYGNVYADGRGRVIITGLVALDQLTLFTDDTTRPRQPSYKLDSIAEMVLGKGKVQFEGLLLDLYGSDIDKFIQYSLNDTDLLKGIEDRVQHISLQDELRQITTTSHNGAASTLGQAEGLFITSMKKKGLIARNKTKTAEKEELPGAYVFDARGGLYEGLLFDFDFTSLYPSIINSWNIGPDTFIGKVRENEIFDIIFNRKDDVGTVHIILDPVHSSVETTMTMHEFNEWVDKNSAHINISGCIYCGHDKYISIFNTVISMLFNGRKIYKAKMLQAKESGDKKNAVAFNGKQMAYKILANSLYGALANEHFKFYNNDLAKSVTLTGQELLKYCTVHCDEFMAARGKVSQFKMNRDFMNKVKSLKDVIYGDTDSMFVYLTDYLKDKKIEVKKSPEVLAEISNIQKFINEVAIEDFLKLHNIPRKDSMIFLKNEYVFSKYYTLNGKKHYAARVVSQEGKDINELEIKGLEIKRSEIPIRARRLLQEILDVIMGDIKKENIKSEVDKIVTRSRQDMIELVEKRDNSVVRTVAFSKPMSDYKVIPRHLKAMMIWNTLIGEDFRHGSKGKLWDIKAIELSKAPESVRCNYNDKLLKTYKMSDIDCICLPEDVETLPPYFIPDIKKIVSYACDDRVANMTEPLWKESDQRLLF